ncbi:TetR/AcrR family transcriptional regulator [Rhizobium beringeri]
MNGVGVAELMREAGLTHGGFYRHFESRDELVSAAVERALAQGSARTVAASGQGGRRALRNDRRRLPQSSPPRPP